MANKLIIFDLDGVLIDSRELHFRALNEALGAISGSKYVISREDHLARFDGLPTKKKLIMLTEEKGLPVELYDDIYKLKQDATEKALLEIQPSEKLQNICKKWKVKYSDYHHEYGSGTKYGVNYKIAVASNAIRRTVFAALESLGIEKYVDFVASNEDVENPKPNPEIYFKCMTACGAFPKDTFIVEDSHIGREGAILSGATLIAVEDPDDVTDEKLFKAISENEKYKHTTKFVPWKKEKLNVLIPMAGAGSRFAAQGYTFPKPLIEVNHKPMIQVVVENLNIDAHYIYLIQKEHYEKYNLKYLMNLITPDCDIVLVDGLTEGAACTTLLAKDLINSDIPLVIANSDQYVDWNSNEVMYAFSADGIDGGILAFHATHPKWSYVSLDEYGFAKEIAEKKVISNNATVGIYFWKKGSDYVKYAEQMIAANDRTNNEFYVAPTFNYAIKDSKKIRVKYAKEMYGLGTPEDLNYFLMNYKKES